MRLALGVLLVVLFCHLRQRAIISAFNPSKLQTVAISPGLGQPIVKMCVLRPFNDKISDYLFFH
jgi:hypothetical protein